MKPNPLEPTHPFLQGCFQKLSEEGIKLDESSPFILCSPITQQKKISFQKGAHLLSYSCCVPPDEYNFAVAITTEGVMCVIGNALRDHVSIDNGNSFDHLVDLQVKINAPQEAYEPIYFVRKTKQADFKENNQTNIKAGDLVSEIFLQIPSEALQDRRLISISSPEATKDMPEPMAQMIKAIAQSDPSDCADLILELASALKSDHEEWLQQQKKVAQLALVTDLIFVPGSTLCKVSYRWEVETGPDRDYFQPLEQMAIVLRINPNYSRMFTYDFFQDSQEGQELLSLLVTNWSSVQECAKHLKSTDLRLPRRKILQIKHSIEFRAAKAEYLTQFVRLNQVPEPIETRTILTKRRANSLELLHTEYLSDIDDVRQPLPFFLGYPLRLFIRASSDLDALEKGERLFDNIIKTAPILFMDEWIARGGNESEIDQTLKNVKNWRNKAPLTTGDWVQIARGLQELQGSALMFTRILEKWPLGKLESLVAMRNPAGHANYDKIAYLEALKSKLPEIISDVRPLFQGIEFICPIGINALDDCHSEISAYKVMGHETPLDSYEFTTDLDPRKFPTGQLIAFDGVKTVLLKRFFKCTPQSMIILNIGLFDGIKGVVRNFVFLHNDERATFVR